MRASHYLARTRLVCKRGIPSSETLCNFQYFQVFPVNATEFRSYVGITSASSPMFVLPVGVQFGARNVARRLFPIPFRDSEEFVTSANCNPCAFSISHRFLQRVCILSCPCIVFLECCKKKVVDWDFVSPGRGNIMLELISF